ncbi:Autoinducer 2 sensor kinase/phosphatase LuxQ [Posidoniimonas polymericola]|uniref:histidine kinase n=1 Tax=Posidoniimonas polymericola TaxID=2528002 RepID=A0A5C5YSG0_9BACT|nr:chemotaxis protein CheB [Posidoniimonas polymericola]TWT77889.1 Autoinducer 2 sensor kinase/phosphatase LuxQ [Posidoniimonas polymericola]
MPSDQEQTAPPSLIVGIGASAGGLEAIERFIDRTPPDTGMAFVLVQHLSPDFKSLMDELLSRWTPMPIHQVEDGMRVEANHIYLMPPRKEMAIADGRLLLVNKDPDATLTLPIDHFFRSLAQDCGPRAVGVILSGTGSDGSRGIVDIHEAGGLALVQDEETAKFDGMPRAARESGVIDLFLAPEDMPQALTRMQQNQHSTALTDLLDSQGLGAAGLKRVFQLIRSGYGVDFNEYKINTVVRRTERRMTFNKVRHIDEYADLLATDREELDALYRDLLIGVTRFFRDGEAYDRLVADVIEPLIEDAQPGQDLRVWVAGCATGEEAYSIAILFDEAVVRSGKANEVKLFATDIHKTSLDVASQGLYSDRSLEDALPERLHQYFHKVSGGYQIKPRIRQSIVFAPHNLIKDAPFTKLDLITCRNLLIYLQPQAQKRVLSLFHFGLRAGGCLFLGPSESPGNANDEFDPINANWKLFKKRHNLQLTPEARLQLGPPPRERQSDRLTSPPRPTRSDPNGLPISTYDELLSTVMPPSLLVSESGDLVYTFGDAGSLLKDEQGRFSAQVLDRLRTGLRSPVSSAVRRALHEEQTVEYQGLLFTDENGEQRRSDLTVRPIVDARQKCRLLLIQVAPQAESQAAASPRATTDLASITAEQVDALETELRYTKENLQATIEQLETSNEELQAANEELVASNEELQSTNEELHSVNEELYSVNAEHQNKISQLSELTRDMDNLLQSTEVHTIFLDAELRIRKFTPRVADSFNVLPQDIGRRIDSFTHSIECDNLTRKIGQVIRTGQAYEEEVLGADDTCFLMRILPYRAASGGIDAAGIDGALLTLVDITKLQKTSEALKESVKQRDRFLAMLSHELRNPLATILNATHLLSASGDDPERRYPAEVIQRQSAQMAALLDDLLDVTRVSHGKIQISHQPFNMLTAVNHAVEGALSQFERREQTLNTKLPEAPIWGTGSDTRILQVVLNLLTNASKYSPRGSQVELALTAEDGQAVISVRDHGMGISADQIDNIFEMFMQSDRTLDRAEGGLGVGLTLVRSLVELHGGTISAHSDGPGKGSEFTVRLPTCDPPAAADLQGPHYRVDRTIERVVLIEDNVDSARMLAYLLEGSGFEVTVEHNGRAGLDAIMRLRPDAAIVDIGLPELDGHEVARRVREAPELADVYLIALTGYGQESDRRLATESGFDEHLVKPVDPDRLSALLSEAKGRVHGPQDTLPS